MRIKTKFDKIKKLMRVESIKRIANFCNTNELKHSVNKVHQTFPWER